MNNITREGRAAQAAEQPNSRVRETNLLAVTGVELVCKSVHLWGEGTWDLSLSGTRDGRAQEHGRAGVVVDLEVVGHEQERL